MVGFLDGFCWVSVGVGMRFLGLVVLWYFPFCFVRAFVCGVVDFVWCCGYLCVGV